MKKQVMIIGVAVLLVCVGLSGCNQGNNPPNNSSPNDKVKFIGTWVNVTTNGYPTAINLFSDNTSVLNTLSGIWGANDGLFALTFNGGYPAAVLSFNYVFSKNNTTVLLTPRESGQAQFFTKSNKSSHGETTDLIGTWTNTSLAGKVTYVNMSVDGSSVVDDISTTWVVKDGKLLIQFDKNTTWVYIYDLSDDANMLSLTATMGGITLVYARG